VIEHPGVATLPFVPVTVFGSDTLDWIILGFAILVVVAWYLSYTAARLDRLHTRVEGTFAALDAQLVRRAEAVLELANSRALDGASSLLLASAAGESLAESEEAAAMDERGEAIGRGDRLEREQVESDLTEALSLTLTPEAVKAVRELSDDDSELLDRVMAAGKRVQLARRFHNDAVTDVRRVRRQFFVRIFRLAGHTPMPRTVEFLDELVKG